MPLIGHGDKIEISNWAIELSVKIASLGGMSHFFLLHSILAALVRHIYLIFCRKTATHHFSHGATMLPQVHYTLLSNLLFSYPTETPSVSKDADISEELSVVRAGGDGCGRGRWRQ